MRKISTLAISLLFTSTSIMAFSKGDGSENNPYIIMNCAELQMMEDNLFAHYQLGTSFSCFSWDYGDDGGFMPIGRDYENPFAGVLDGQGYEIRDLHINRPMQDHVGLFGYTHHQTVEGGRISHIGLIDPMIFGKNYVGGITGTSQYTIIDNSFVEGGTIEGASTVGGISGFHLHKVVQNSYTNTTVISDRVFGGLVGESRSEIVNSHAHGDILVQSTLGNHMGGLIGINRNIVRESYSTTDISGVYYVGGLIGSNHGDIEASYATGNVIGDYTVGGLVGESSGKITDSYAIGNVSIHNDSYGYRDIGGLAGRIDSYGNMSQSAIIEYSYATGNVTGSRNVGGLVGENYDGIITVSYATGHTKGHENVGGLVGKNITHWFDTIISQSYAMGSVEGLGYVGGLVGFNFAGGLPCTDAVISQSYAVGFVFAEYDAAGGLVGFRNSHGGNPIVVESYWDIESSQQDTSEGGIGKETTKEMMKEETFIGWDFDTVWQIDEDISYPYHQDL